MNKMNLDYYYNNVPNEGLQRNNLIYTSLISTDKKTFVQWYHNDTEYHNNKNEVVDPDKMLEKWEREVKFLLLMYENYPAHVPEIMDINFQERKIYLRIEGPDLWQQSMDINGNFHAVLPDWDIQMLEIIESHKKLGLHKYSMHPSSYFIVEGKLKSINYFFTYFDDEPLISICDVESHIHTNRRNIMKQHLQRLGIKWNEPQPWRLFDMLCWESFSSNYPKIFIDKIKQQILNIDE